MYKFYLVCSRDETNIDFEMPLYDADPEYNEKLSYGECIEFTAIAEKHGCQYWTIEKAED